MMAAVLEARELSKSFRGFQALRDVTFVLGTGEMRGLIGANGAGKSTLLHLIYGQETPDRGVIVFGGQDVVRLPAYQRARLGMALKFQVTSVFEELTVDENLRLGAQPKTHASDGNGIEQLGETLELIELQDRRHWRASELSHGQKQWLEIGMVLLTRPRLLLLDEPTSGMSRAESHRTAELLHSLRDREAVEAMVVVEHDMDFIKLVSDRVTVLHRGQVLAEGTVAEMQEDTRVQAAYLGRLQ